MQGRGSLEVHLRCATPRRFTFPPLQISLGGALEVHVSNMQMSYQVHMRCTPLEVHLRCTLEVHFRGSLEVHFAKA